MTTATAPRMTEAEWQRQVTDLAELYGWTWAHFRPAQTSKGWRTAVSGPGGAGFPDLVLWRERVIFAELKTDKGRVRPEQEATLDALGDAGVEAYLWRPRDFDFVRAVIGRTPSTERPRAGEAAGGVAITPTREVLA